MAYIGRQLARGENKLFDDISSSFNGSTTTFNLTVSSVATATATPYQLFVSLGGVMQKPNTDFTTAGNQITFTTAPAAGLSCWIMMQGDTIDNAAVADASITPSKISGTNFAFSGDLRLKDADGSHYVGFASPTTVTTNKVWTLPGADGSNGHALTTNGSGVLSFSAVTTSPAGSDREFQINNNGSFGSTSTMKISGDDIYFYGASTSIYWDQSASALQFAYGGPLKLGNNAYIRADHNGGSGAEKLVIVGETGGTDITGNVAITGALSVSTNATITGNLTVSGTTTTINTQTLDVEDKNVVIGKVSSPSDTTADGGGWTLKGASDKTFNWVNATDAWTSSEHIHLIDNKKLLVGGASGTVDGLEIVHNGSNSILNDSGTGTLQLQLGGSTKLEIQSGGINVTGAINVNGAALSTAPTITATASGSISAHAAVSMKTDGNVVAISGNTNNVTSNQINADSRTERGAIVYDPNKDKYVALYLKGAGSVSDLYGRVGTLSGDGANASGSMSWGTETNITNGQAGNVYAAYDSNVNRILIAMLGSTNSSGALRLRQVAINSAGTGFDIGNNVNVGVTCYQGGAVLSNKPNSYGRHMLVYRTGSNMYARGVKPGSDINSIDMNSAVNWTSSWNNNAYSPYTCVLEEHSSPQRFIVGVNGGGNNPNQGILGSCYNSSDSTTVFPTATRYQFNSNSEVQQQWGVYDSTNDRTFLIGRKNTGRKGFIWILRTNGDNWTIGSTPYEFTDSSGDFSEIHGGSDNNRTFAGQFDPETARVHVWWTRNTDEKPVRSVFEVDTSDDTVSEPLPKTLVFSDATTWYSQNVTYDTSAKRIVWYATKQNDNTTLYSTVFQPQSTNLTASNFIGFSSAGYTNGQTATINVVGNTTTKSSLTPGSKYYTQIDGTVSTTAGNPSVIAGVALSSTKLLIKPA